SKRKARASSSICVAALPPACVSKSAPTSSATATTSEPTCDRGEDLPDLQEAAGRALSSVLLEALRRCRSLALVQGFLRHPCRRARPRRDRKGRGRLVTPGTRLRAELAKGAVIAPGAYDALSARIAAKAGAKTVYMSGFGVAGSLLGVPDIGLVNAAEMVERVGALSAACAPVPLIADGDNGY